MENTQNTEVGNTQTQQPVDSGADSTPKKTEDKKFTQEDVNAIVAGRLAKEREKFADYDSLKTRVGELQEIKEKYTKLSETAKVNEDTLSEVYNGLTAELDEEKKNLIPDNLSLTDKIKYINKNRKTFQVKQVIQTPAPEDKSKGEAGLYGGKYKTMQEFAQADPKGYLEWRKNSLSK